MDDEYWASTISDECFPYGPYPSHEAAVEEIRQSHGVTQRLWVGRRKEVDIAAVCPKADAILEGMGESMYEQCGEACEGWPAPTQEQEDELTVSIANTITEWLTRCDLMPKFFSVVNVRTVTPEGE